MKTTLEIPDALLSRARVCAESNGQTLNVFLTEALEARLASPPEPELSSEKPWIHIFEGLERDAAFHAEIARINAAIEDEFEHVEQEEIS